MEQLFPSEMYKAAQNESTEVKLLSKNYIYW